MSITLLLDLDGTLLDIDLQAFAPAYFSALSTALAEAVPPDVMIPALIGGTKAMKQNENPAVTLQEVFDAFFFPTLRLQREALQEKIDQFYDKIFPTLQYVAEQRPEAIAFIQWAFSAGHRVAVATNPYFPIKAIHHRLRWAGLPPEEYPFALVSSYETFHFTKETSTYFPEFLAQMGWPEGPMVMVGNDLNMDLLPAQKAGLPIYWLREGRDDTHSGIPQGSFADLRTWLEATDPASLTPAFSTPEAIIHILRSTPSALATLTTPVPIEIWSRPPASGEWCLNEILCHLRDVESEINLPRVNKILAEENPFFPGVVSDDWAAERQYSKQDGRQALEDFLITRQTLIDLFNDGRISWAKPARHAIFGPTTLLELAGFMAGHDRAHIQQIWKTRPH